MNSDFEVEFGARMNAARRAKKVTQRQLADALMEAGVSLDSPQISRIEQGKKLVRLREAAAIAMALGVDLNVLTPTTTVVPEMQEPVDELTERVRAIVRAEMEALGLS